MDDEEVDKQRRYDYRITASLDGYHDGEGEVQMTATVFDRL